MKFNADGPEGLIDRKAPGQPPRLNDGHHAALAAILESGPIPAVHGVVRWRIVDLCQWIFEEFRVALSQQTLSRALRKMGYRKLSARPAIMPRPPALSRILKKPPHAPGRDRAREGRRSQRDRTLVRRRVASRAEEQDHPPLGQARLAPKLPSDQRTASAYIFGAICPKEGKGAALVMPRCDNEAMNLHLAEIATQIAPGAHAAILVDQAGWHLSGGLNLPSNITLIALPAKCPELNPQENIWQFMRENWLSNRIFKSFDDIVDHCCHAWNKLIDQPWRIMSIGMREWAHRF
jgi:hypothetical protein